ncbi:hypothetical protein OKW21_003876 [Catalinimonas alkaloidigena]|nr:hypothetical protein [Catalinimonas alkaloidigena]
MFIMNNDPLICLQAYVLQGRMLESEGVAALSLFYEVIRKKD